MEHTEHENPQKGGGEKEFIAIYDTFADPVFRYIFLRVKNREDALDLTQYVFTRFFEYLKKNTVEYPKAFLFRQAHNAIANHWRAKRNNFSLDLLAEEGFDVSSNDHARLGVAHDTAKAMAILAELPDAYEEVLLLHYIEDLDIGEIADLKGEHQNTISVRLHRAKKMLKEMLEKKQYE